MPDISTGAFAAYITSTRCERTALKYQASADDFLIALRGAGITDFQQMPRGALNRYVQILADKGYAPASIHVYVAAVKRYLRWVEDQGVEVPKQSNPDVPKVRVVMRDILNPAMVHAYVGYANDLLNEPARTAAIMLPFTGLRAQEMVNLPLEAIRKTEIEVNKRPHKVLALRVTGKGNKQRTVPIVGEGSKYLIEYLAGWRKTQKGPFVYPGARSRHNRSGTFSMCSRSLRVAVSELRKPFGMSFTPHTMRRTYLVGLWRMGVDAPTIAKIAGHANIQTLFQHYLNLDEEDVLRAVHSAEGAKRNG